MKFLAGLIRFLTGLTAVGLAALTVAALFGFAVPYFDLINHLQLPLFFATLLVLIVAIFAFGRLRAITLIALIGFLASGAVFVPEWAASLTPRAPIPTDGRQVFIVMTHNLFGLNYDMHRVSEAIAAENPDIVALQEYFPEQVEDLDRLLKPNYPYSVRCSGGKRANLGLYSKIPFDNEMGNGDCPKQYDWANGQRTAHIIAGFTLMDGTHFTVVTTHMDWPYPIERQRAEFSALTTELARIDGPLIVAGDFNSTPWSYALRNFASVTGLTRETHNLVTYPLLFTLRRLVPTLPFLPLDQVFQRGVVVHDLHAGEQTGSDHLPVVFSFSVER